MDLNKEEYKREVERSAKKSPIAKNCVLAFLFGGVICTFGQLLFDIYSNVTPYEKDDVGTLVTITVIFIAAFMTGIGVFDDIAKYAGAGTPLIQRQRGLCWASAQKFSRSQGR